MATRSSTSIPTATDLSAARGAAAHYDAVRRRVVVELTNGYAFEIPIEKLPEIAAAPAGALASVEILGAGNVLHWDSLDADYSIPALVLRAVGEVRSARICPPWRTVAVPSESRRRASEWKA